MSLIQILTLIKAILVIHITLNQTVNNISDSFTSTFIIVIVKREKTHFYATYTVFIYIPMAFWDMDI